jgi:tripartite ATP-independent transporter DctM subunit
MRVRMSNVSAMILQFALMLGGMVLGHHLGFVLMSSGLIVGLVAMGPARLAFYMNRLWGIMNNWEMLAVPLFLLMGNFLAFSGVADKLFDALYKLMGRLRGGIAVAVIIVSTIFAACTGVIAASVTTMAILAMPIMLKYGYDKRLAAGTVMAGGTLGILIPPSIMLILFGSYSNVSVGRLFVAAVMPGILLSFLYILYVLIRCYKDPKAGPAMSAEEYASIPRAEVLKEALTNLVPPVLLIIGVLGSIFAGVATPTEAAAIGATVALLMVIAYKRFSWKVLKDAIFDTAKGTAMVLMLVVGASFFTGTFIGIGGGDLVRDLLFSLGSGNKWAIFGVMMFIIFILGMFIDWVGIAMICLPIFVPVAIELGFDPLWFLMTCAVNLQMSFLTPPFGYAIFFLKSTMPEKDMTFQEACLSVPIFIALQALGLALCVVFPRIVTWLPSFVVK